jgi:hypothetical protein
MIDLHLLRTLVYDRWNLFLFENVRTFGAAWLGSWFPSLLELRAVTDFFSDVVGFSYSAGVNMCVCANNIS